MSGIFWLASYPKSGNTWLRAFLTNYLRESDEPADINELDGGWTASLRGQFEEIVGIEGTSRRGGVKYLSGNRAIAGNLDRQAQLGSDVVERIHAV